jgi:electron transfer flavoprotein alpha subunit
MADVRFTVVAQEPTAAESLVGMLPGSASVELVLLGTEASAVPAELRRLAVERIVAVADVTGREEPRVVGSAVRELVAGRVVVLDSTQASRDLAGWLCAVLDVPLVWAVDAVRLAEDGGVEADRVVLGGSHRLVHHVAGDRGAVVMAKPTGGAADRSAATGEVEVVAHSAAVPADRVRVLAAATAASREGVPLAAARIVVSIGRGIGGPDQVPLFRELADRVGAALGASRVAVDAGWIPFAHQVGQTGTAVAPEVYVAFGVSGAIQHLAGMRGSKRIVAVNTDKEASLCRLADLVVNADATEVAERLLKRLAEAGAAG